MATLADGREVPFDDIGVLAPGGGTRGITAAGAAELTRQRFANTSGPTRALGMALGAAETIVPAAGSPKETLRTLAKAARDYIVHGQEQSVPGFATLGVARNALEQGYTTGTQALAGDPHAQGTVLAAVSGAALAARSAFYGRAADALPPRAAVDLTPSPKLLLDPLNVPAYQRRPAPDMTQRFPTDHDVRFDVLRKRIENDRRLVGPPETWTPMDPPLGTQDWRTPPEGFFDVPEPKDWDIQNYLNERKRMEQFNYEKPPWYNNPSVVAGLQKMQDDLNKLPRLVAKPGYEAAVPSEPIKAKLTGMRVRRKKGSD